MGRVKITANLTTKRTFFILALASILAAFLAGCLSTNGEPTATQGNNATQAYQTVIARVTEVSALTGTPPGEPPTPPPTDSGLPTSTSSPEPTPIPPAATVPPTATPIPCDLAAPGSPIDVTIPDDTEIAPGAVFTKTWQLINAGTCTWTADYAAVWISGDQMNAPDAVSLPTSTSSGQSLEFSVVMQAPAQPGSYQGNWMLRNAAGETFAIGPAGKSPFWVRIVVPEPAPTLTPTTPITITATPEPEIAVSGAAVLAPGSLLDLDSNVVDGGGEDLAYQAASDGNHLLTPQGGALLGVFGGQQPSRDGCLAASMSTASIAVESLPTGTYLCAQTGEGRLGWLQIEALDPDNFNLSLALLTWALPESAP